MLQLKKIYIVSTQALNNRVLNVKVTLKFLKIEKNYVSKHLYECSNEIFKIMPKYKLLTTPYSK